MGLHVAADPQNPCVALDELRVLLPPVALELLPRHPLETPDHEHKLDHQNLSSWASGPFLVSRRGSSQSLRGRRPPGAILTCALRHCETREHENHREGTDQGR